MKMANSNTNTNSSPSNTLLCRFDRVSISLLVEFSAIMFSHQPRYILLRLVGPYPWLVGTLFSVSWQPVPE